MKESDIVGLQEIARALNVNRETVWAWTKRYPDFPKPIATLRMGRIWNFATVCKWYDEHGPKQYRPDRRRT